jgi:hypothetical protein
MTDQDADPESSAAPVGTFGYMLQVLKGHTTQLRPDLTDEEYWAAIGYIDRRFGHFNAQEVVARVDGIRAARQRLDYVASDDFWALRPIVLVSGQPATLADELVRGIEALRPRPVTPGRPGAPSLSEAACRRELVAALERLAARGDLRPTRVAIAGELGVDPHTLRGWLRRFPGLRSQLPT